MEKEWENWGNEKSKCSRCPIKNRNNSLDTKNYNSIDLKSVSIWTCNMMRGKVFCTIIYMLRKLCSMKEKVAGGLVDHTSRCNPARGGWEYKKPDSLLGCPAFHLWRI